jgi:hypothetical protein
MLRNTIIPRSETLYIFFSSELESFQSCKGKWKNNANNDLPGSIKHFGMLCLTARIDMPGRARNRINNFYRTGSARNCCGSATSLQKSLMKNIRTLRTICTTYLNSAEILVPSHSLSPPYSQMKTPEILIISFLFKFSQENVLPIVNLIYM